MKNKVKMPDPINVYDMQMYTLPEQGQQVFGSLVWRVDDTPKVEITAIGATFEKVAKILQTAMWRVQADLRGGQLILPDMGDYDVRYFSTD